MSQTQQIPMVFEVKMSNREEAAKHLWRALTDLILIEPPIEEWWLPEADLKHIDRNSHPAMTLSKDPKPHNLDLSLIAKAAWEAREKAVLTEGGKTPVGCAVLASSTAKGPERIFTGCNIQHRYRSHDIHAETNAISSAVAAGHCWIRGIVIAAERDNFTPCGACLDWIFEFGGPDTPVGWQADRGAQVRSLTAAQLMPHYPS